MNDLVICAIVSQETPYLAEWIRYYQFHGVSHFYLYDNDPAQPLSIFFKDSHLVTVKPWVGYRRQFDAYHDFIKMHNEWFKTREESQWVLFVDVDEFVVCWRHATLLDFAKEYLKEGAIAINEVLFGSSRHVMAEPYPVIQRFTMRRKEADPLVKCLCVCADLEEYNNPHYPTKLKRGTVHDHKGNILDGPFNARREMDMINVFHYFTKSKEESIQKMRRGTAGMGIIRPLTDFENNDWNEVEDLKAWEWYVFHHAQQIEGWLSYKEGFELAQLARKKMCVEIGSFKGRSACFMATYAFHVDCVDTFKAINGGQQQHDQTTTLQDFLNNTAMFLNIQSYQTTSLEAAKMLGSKSCKYELIFIDALHTYESVKADIQAWLPHLQIGGRICFHDFKNGWPGVDQAINELIPNAYDHHIDSLFVSKLYLGDNKWK